MIATMRLLETDLGNEGKGNKMFKCLFAVILVLVPSVSFGQQFVNSASADADMSDRSIKRAYDEIDAIRLVLDGKPSAEELKSVGERLDIVRKDMLALESAGDARFTVLERKLTEAQLLMGQCAKLNVGAQVTCVQAIVSGIPDYNKLDNVPTALIDGGGSIFWQDASRGIVFSRIEDTPTGRGRRGGVPWYIEYMAFPVAGGLIGGAAFGMAFPDEVAPNENRFSVGAAGKGALLGVGIGLGVGAIIDLFDKD